VDFRGQRRTNDTHASTTDADAKLFKKAKGQEAKLGFLGHVLMENRNGLVVGTRLTAATGTAERQASLEMMGAQRRPKQGGMTLGGDKNYDTHEHVAALRQLKVTPHVAQNTARPGGSAIDQRTTRHAGYALSQTKRKRVEEIFGWFKTIALMAQDALPGLGTSGMDLHLDRGGLQSGAHEKPAGSNRMKPGERCVPNRNRTWGGASEGQPKGFRRPCPRLGHSRVRDETKFVR
jgi:hypothetical protein